MSWTIHNRLIHPICAVMRAFGFQRLANRFHDNHMPDAIGVILWDLD